MIYCISDILSISYMLYYIIITFILYIISSLLFIYYLHLYHILSRECVDWNPFDFLRCKLFKLNELQTNRREIWSLRISVLYIYDLVYHGTPRGEQCYTPTGVPRTCDVKLLIINSYLSFPSHSSSLTSHTSTSRYLAYNIGASTGNAQPAWLNRSRPTEKRTNQQNHPTLLLTKKEIPTSKQDLHRIL